MNDFGRHMIINVRSTIVKMRCGDRKSCEDEIKRYPDEPHMPGNHNFRIMMRDATWQDNKMI